MFKAATLARTCLAGLALVVLSASLANAIYGPRTTIGKNYQQWSSTESNDGVNSGNCNSTFCYLVFQAIPQQQPLIVQHVACRATVTTGGLTLVRLGTRKGPTFQNRNTPLVPVYTTGNYWAVNSPVMHLLKSGERPYVFFFNSTAATWGLDCSISGRLQQP